jgi:hypothetical protein
MDSLKLLRYVSAAYRLFNWPSNDDHVALSTASWPVLAH